MSQYFEGEIIYEIKTPSHPENFSTKTFSYLNEKIVRIDYDKGDKKSFVIHKNDTAYTFDD